MKYEKGKKPKNLRTLKILDSHYHTLKQNTEKEHVKYLNYSLLNSVDTSSTAVVPLAL